MHLSEARQRWAAAQELGPRTRGSLHDAVARTGWIRTLGGCEAYLALHARVDGVTVDGVTQAVRAGELQLLPSVRGCMYLVPRADAGLSLRVADRLSRRRIARDLEKVGVDDADLARVQSAALAVASSGSHSTAELGKQLPGGVVRSLGPAGKKVGMSTALPAALRLLELDGRLSRTAVDGRLDHERYTWAVPTDNPLDRDRSLDDDGTLYRALADRYVRWAGPATVAAFAAWSGLGKRAAAAATAHLAKVDVDGTPHLAHPEALDASPAAHDRVAWLPALDNLYALHETPASLVDPADGEVVVASFGRPATARLGEARNLFDRVLTRAGRIVGLWAWQPEDAEVVFRSFTDLGDVDADRLSARDLLRALGHGKRFSLDSDAALTALAARVTGG